MSVKGINNNPLLAGMPRLLQIDSCRGILSTGRISEGIAAVAMAQGWDCYIAHGARYVGKTIQRSYQIESKIGEYLHYFKSLLFDAHGLGSKHATKRLVRYIESIKPDIIQLHCIHGYYLNYRVLFSYLKESGIPVVWTQHDCWSFTGHCAYFGFADCYKWIDNCSDCPLKHTYPRSIVDKANRNYNLKKTLFTSVGNMTVVSVSGWLNSVVEKSFIRIYPHRVIYNGIDTDVFRRYDVEIKSKYGIKGRHYLLAVSSAWSDEKGLSDYQKLSTLLPDDISIVLVGVDEETRKHLSPKIVAISRTDSKKELAYLYSNALFLMSLSYCETMGLTIAEAMACGTPSIVYDNTAQPELVSTDVGYVIPTGHYEMIPDIVSDYLKCGEAELSLKRTNCINRAFELFDEKKQYGKYVDLYNQVIHNGINEIG